jgi:hypothetical protein
VQAKVYGDHGPEAALAVHDAVVEGEGERAAATKGVARDDCDRGEGEVDDGVEKLF